MAFAAGTGGFTASPDLQAQITPPAQSATDATPPDATSLDPQSAALFRDALAAQRQQDLPAAEKDYTALVQTAPQFLPARFNLGLVLDGEGKPQPALDQFNQVRTESGDFPGVQLFTGIENFRLGNLSDAESALRIATKQSPGDTRCWFWLAKTEFAMQRDTEGKAALDAALRTSPEDPSALYLLSQYDIAGQDLAGGESVLTGLVSRYPQVPEFHQSLGSVYYLEARLDKAEEEYRNQLAIDPHNPQALSMLGVILLDRGQAAEAIPLLQLGLDANPKIPYLQRKLGQAYFEEDRLQDAIPHLQQAVALDPQESTAHFLLWKIYTAQHKPKEAAAELAAFRKIQPAQANRPAATPGTTAPRGTLP
ncbi:MAG: tetratricopeptide repeat protein [Acidobacteriaceae bacterium]